MLAWIITLGEPIPNLDGENIRLWRSVMITNELLRSGHKVVRWTSTFDHSNKKQRFDQDTVLQVDDHYEIRLLKGAGYKKNISFQRLLDHIQVARKFRHEAVNQPKPDVILCSLPTIELCVEAANFGKKNGIPVVFDARDMWPDIFVEAFPEKLRFLSKIVLFPMYQMVKKACQNATALSGISEPYIKWQLDYAHRERNTFDRYFPMAYTAQAPTPEAVSLANTFWDSQGIVENGFYICLFATLEQGFDISTVIESAKMLEKLNAPIKFVLCGDGSKLGQYKLESKECNNVIFPGWVDSAKIWSLMRRSSVGILPYWNKANFLLNIPNKPIEYMSAGLVIVSSLRGVIGQLIEQAQCGMFYTSAQELADCVLFLYQNPTARQRMGQNAYELYEQQFVAEKVYKQMAEYLVDVAKKHTQPLGA